MDRLFIVSSSPHIRSNVNTKKIMRDVFIALAPAMIAGIIYFGLSALYLTIILRGNQCFDGVGI
jgi:electron transport complex protein RnfD